MIPSSIPMVWTGASRPKVRVKKIRVAASNSRRKNRCLPPGAWSLCLRYRRISRSTSWSVERVIEAPIGAMSSSPGVVSRAALATSFLRPEGKALPEKIAAKSRQASSGSLDKAGRRALGPQAE